jgi:hypothetical protein
VGLGRSDLIQPVFFRTLLEGMLRDIATGLQVGHDSGSQYMSDYFLVELCALGIMSSQAFVRAHEGERHR